MGNIIKGSILIALAYIVCFILPFDKIVNFLGISWSAGIGIGYIFAGLGLVGFLMIAIGLFD